MAAKKKKQVERLGHAKTMEIQIEVDNPYYAGAHDGESGNDRTIKAAINMRESPSAHWYHKDIIDAAQYRASTEFRRLWERTGGKGAGSFDYTKDKVDGGLPADPINIGQMEASRKLKDIHSLIGPQGYDIVLNICALCIDPKHLSKYKSQQEQMQNTCCQLLTRIAEYWGYETRKRYTYQTLEVQRG